MKASAQQFQCVDLHCHSTVSDGVLDPDVLALRAAAQEVDLWALTDHDEVSGIAQARQTALGQGISFLAGVEISVTWCGRTVHIVGLGVDETNPMLLTGLKKTRQGRVQRALEMAKRFEGLGIADAYAGALKFAGNAELISRTHFARHLVQSGHAQQMQDVFDRYLGDDGPANVPVVWASLNDAIGWIGDAGGVAVLAHPGRYKYTSVQFDALFAQFKELGGKAIEVNTGSHMPHQFAQYAAIAKRFGFLASCGSDFHGPDESRRDLGEVAPLSADLQPVWQCLEIEQP
jgi:3',5'-nucleoside bisphosphate phosphatase